MRKKVFLLNSHLEGLLNSPKQFIQETYNIFNVFKGRKDAVILWRPHPLLESAIESMRPEIYQDYKKLINLFQKMENGIFDNSPDLDRAIVISDAYIGHASSSLSALYREIKKPMMLLVDYNEAESKPFISVHGLIETDGTIYFTDFWNNALFTIDKYGTKDIKHMETIPTEKQRQPHLYHTLYVFKNICFMIPGCGRNITCLNLKNMSYSTISHGIDREVAFVGKVIVKEPYLYMLSPQERKLYFLNMDTNEFGEFACWGKNGDSGEILYWSGCIKGNKLILCPYDSDEVIVINMDIRSVEKYSFPYNKKAFRDVIFDGQNIWFCPDYYNKLLKWDLKERKLSEIGLQYSEPVRYAYMFLFREEIYCFPLFGSGIPICFDKNGEIVWEFKNFSNLWEGKEIIISYFLKGEELYIKSPYYHCFYRFDLNERKFVTYQTDVEPEFYFSSLPVPETNNRLFTVENFVDVICRQQNDMKACEDDYRNERSFTHGEKIWGKIKATLGNERI